MSTLRLLPAALVLAFPAVRTAVAQAPEQIDVPISGAHPTGGWANAAFISGSGRYVTFQYTGFFGTGGGYNSVYIRDRELGVTEQVDRGLGGAVNDQGSWDSALSFDGRFVAFASVATNLVSGDTNGARDVFVLDRRTHTTTRVSVASNGAEAHGDAAIDNNARSLDISANGRFVAFHSLAPDLVPNDGNGVANVYLHDRLTGTTELVDVATDGTPSNGESLQPRLSADGRFVVFESTATNLAGLPTRPGFAVYRRDRLLGTTTLVGVGSAGAPARRETKNPAISGDGRFVVFESSANELDPSSYSDGNIQIYLRDTVLGTTTRVSRPLPGQQNNGAAREAAISLDGNWVVFSSFSTTLVPNDTNGQRDVFRWNRATGMIYRVSLAASGAEPTALSVYPVIDGTGRTVVYQSWAPNILIPDANGAGASIVAQPY